MNLASNKSLKALLIIKSTNCMNVRFTRYCFTTPVASGMGFDR